MLFFTITGILAKLTPHFKEYCIILFRIYSSAVDASYARFYQLGLNLGIAIPRPEDIPRFIVGLSFGVLSAFSNLGLTNLGISRLSL